MTENEKICYRILDFLKSVKLDINITDEILSDRFNDISKDRYSSAIDALLVKKAIGKTSPNNQWRITELGENELSRLQKDTSFVIKGHWYRIVHNHTYQFIAATVGIISFIILIWELSKPNHIIPETKSQADTSKKENKPFQSEKIHNDSVGKVSK